MVCFIFQDILVYHIADKKSVKLDKKNVFTVFFCTLRGMCQPVFFLFSPLFKIKVSLSDFLLIQPVMAGHDGYKCTHFFGQNISVLQFLTESLLYTPSSLILP